ncbi:hypothetical protein J4422_03160 [Candidatus Pacearchaeota archaeon]|nr:hypothetical protein [Candidatus Pacearchaeota archaeon]
MSKTSNQLILRKRGQVTIFIIIAVLILAGVALFLILKGGVFDRAFEAKEDDISALSREAVQVRNYVDNCFERALKTTLFINALQGGYYIAPIELPNLESYSTSTYIHYYVVDNKTFIPTKNVILDQISIGVFDQLSECIKNSNFPYKINYSLSEIKINTSLDDEKIIMNAYFPISVDVEGSVSYMKRFSEEVSTEYFRFYKLAEEISEEQATHPNRVCVSCFDDFSKRYGMSITSDELYENNELILIYSLEKYQYKEDPVLVYSFAHKLKLE